MGLEVKHFLSQPSRLSVVGPAPQSHCAMAPLHDHSRASHPDGEEVHMTAEGLGQIFFAFRVIALFGGYGASQHARSAWPFPISGAPGFLLMIIGGFLWWLGS